QAATDIDKIVEAVGVPGRAFGEDKVRRQPLRRPRLQDVVEPGHLFSSHQTRLAAGGYSRPAGMSISAASSGKSAFRQRKSASAQGQNHVISASYRDWPAPHSSGIAAELQPKKRGEQRNLYCNSESFQ